MVEDGRKRKSVGDGEGPSWFFPEQFSPSNPPHKRRRRSPSNSQVPLTDPPPVVKYLSPSLVDLTGSPPTAITAPTISYRDVDNHWFSDDGARDVQSCDSTLVDSPQWEESFLSQFIRSPSPDRVSSPADTEEQASNVHDTEFPSADAERDTMTGHDRQTGQPSEEHDKIRIRLRLKPPKITIALRRPGYKTKRQRLQ